MQERDLLNRPKQQKRKLLHTKKTEKQPDLQNRKKKKSSRKVQRIICREEFWFQASDESVPRYDLP